MLISTPLINVRTDYQCDDCMTGKLFPVAQPPKLSAVGGNRADDSFLHVCNNCDAQKTLSKRYPLFESIKFFDFLQTLNESTNGK